MYIIMNWNLWDISTIILLVLTNLAEILWTVTACFNAWYYKLIIVLDRENHCANQKKYTRPISIYFNTLCTKKILVDYLIFRYTELLPRFVLPVNICDQHSPYIWSYLPLDHVLVILSSTYTFYWWHAIYLAQSSM